MADADETRQDADAGAAGEATEQVITRELSLDEAVSTAIVFLKDRQLEEAERLLRAVLEVAADHPAALHYSGVLAHQQNRHDEGLALIRRSLELEPAKADWHSNLGIVLKAAGKRDEAMAAYQRAIDLDPGHAKAHNNLGVLQKAKGLAAEAEASYREAIRLNPRYAEAYHNLGTLLWNLRRLRDAVLAFNRVLVLSPAEPDAQRFLAGAHCALGEPEKAVLIYDDWLRKEPDNPVALHMRAACSGQAVPERASDAFIELAFDSFAATFDEKLAGLEYRAPQIVAAMLADAGLPAAGDLDVLDAGCGTGLCGPLLRPYARRLVGVDLSGQMLAKAEERKVYDDLCRAELTGFLAAHPGTFDVVTSADTLVYFGGLEEVARAAASALRPGGRLIFTVEAEVDGDARFDYELRYQGRYVHTRPYLEDVLRRAGFQTDIVQAELRMEGGLPVAGFAVRATTPGSGPGPRNGADDA